MVRYQYPPALIRRLPDKDAGWRFKSCALVGNAGRILAEEHGKEIDQHQVRAREHSSTHARVMDVEARPFTQKRTDCLRAGLRWVLRR